MIITVGGSKGGTGKSTLACQLAVYRAGQGKRVLLVDADEQQSSKLFSTQRKTQYPGYPQYHADTHLDDAVRLEVSQRREEYEDIVIDTGGRDSRSQRSALAIADIVLIPFKPRSLDLWTIADVVKILTLMRSVNPALRAVSLINQADARGTENAESQALLTDVSEIEFSGVIIGTRKAYGKAMAQGLGVSELRPGDKKAAAEIAALVHFLF